MGIGANAAKYEPAISHLLSDRVQYHFVATDPTPEQARHFVDEFEVWVVANGLRDLVEGHATFLDATFMPHRLILEGEAEYGDLQERFKRFERRNVLEKRATLLGDLGSPDVFEPMFATLLQARNCLAHRNGVVGVIDDNTGGGGLELTWRFHGLKLAGGHVDLNLLGEGEGVHVEKGAVSQLGPVDRSRRFPVGTQLRITRHELAEICFGMSVAAESVLEPLMAIAREKGLLPTVDPAQS